jgi:hypothetical protein
VTIFGYRNFWLLSAGTGSFLQGDVLFEVEVGELGFVVEPLAEAVLVVGDDDMSKSALIEVVKGEDATKVLVFTNVDGTAFDLSVFDGGGNIELSVKAAAQDAVTPLFATLSLTGGELAFETPPGTTGRLLATFARALTDTLTEDSGDFRFDVKGTATAGGAVTQLARDSRFRLLPRVTE